eukprot:6385087-Amphidinium_carterae.1
MDLHRRSGRQECSGRKSGPGGRRSGRGRNRSSRTDRGGYGDGIDDRKIVDTPIAEVTTEGHYGVEAILHSGAGASVCSPNGFPNIAINTQSEVTKTYRCADGRELKVYGYKRVKAIVGKTQQILQ